MNQKYIYIDDDPDDHETFRMLISELGLQAMTITSDMHFFDYIQDDLFQGSVIFVDLKLSKISGQEIISRLRGRFSKDELPIIVISGSQNAAVADECHRLRADTYIGKTFRYETLKQ